MKGRDSGAARNGKLTMSLNAADKLEKGDPVTEQNGMLSAIAALKVLMYPPPGAFGITGI
jgi:hypothetical protein